MSKIFKILGFFFYKFEVFKTKMKQYYLSSLVISDNGTICGNTELTNPDNIFIGKNSFVNGGQLCAGKRSKIIIGDNCMLSYNVHLRTVYHNYKDRTKPMNAQGQSESDIIIEDNCWICHSAQIMAGCTVHTGSVVAAGAVVTKDVPPNVCVWGGTSPGFI